MSKAKRLERIEKAVAERVAELKSELDQDLASRNGGARSERCKRLRSGPAGSSGRGRN
jgi:hypothetical protein